MSSSLLLSVKEKAVVKEEHEVSVSYALSPCQYLETVGCHMGPKVECQVLEQLFLTDGMNVHLDSACLCRVSTTREMSMQEVLAGELIPSLRHSTLREYLSLVRYRPSLFWGDKVFCAEKVWDGNRLPRLDPKFGETLRLIASSLPEFLPAGTELIMTRL